MKTCPNCHTLTEDDALFCPVCGSGVNANPSPDPSYQPDYAYTPPQPKVNRYDHTADFAEDDIESNKLLCMLVYLVDYIGIIIALLAAKESEYTAFHIRQAIKFSVVQILATLAASLLCWTFIVPIVACIGLTILTVLKIIAFFQVCKGKAVEPAIIRDLKFLK